MTIKPALSPEEWRDGIFRDDYTAVLRNVGAEGTLRVDVTVHAHPLGGMGASRDLHALAALCLHGQPFGFTREDVTAIRDFTAGLMSKSYGGPGGPHARQLDALADRIEALLPPEGT